MRVHILCVLDESGSMSHLRSDTLVGFNTFLEEQKKVPGEATLTLCTFNVGQPRYPRENKPLRKVKPLKEREYVPQGNTALLDALGDALVRTELFAWQTQPDKVLVFITTDGAENASTRMHRRNIRVRIAELRMRGWEFHYHGANVDTFAESGSLGISRQHTRDFTTTSSGLREYYENLNRITTDSRG